MIVDEAHSSQSGESAMELKGVLNADRLQEEAAAIPANSAPALRYDHSSVWTGSELIAWGWTDGTNYLATGARLNPLASTWTTTTNTSAPTARAAHTAVWTGSEMLILGGYIGSSMNSGSRYNPLFNIWATITTSGAPSARYYPSAVWTGSEMIVWGGAGSSGSFSDGARYNPSLNTWAAITTTNAPTSRY